MQTEMQGAAAETAEVASAPELVDSQWLADHLTDPSVTVVEVDVSADRYQAGHIAGAVLWNVYGDLKTSEYHSVGAAELQSLMQRSGIGPDSTVVFYGYAAALGFWFLTSTGVAAGRILNCSRETWQAENRAWSSTTTQATASSVRLRGQEQFRADEAAVREAIGRSDTTLVDVRSLAEYRGDCFWPSGGMEPGGRSGHLPSAVHQPIDGLYDDAGAFRPPNELRRIFGSVDLDGDSELITYCTIGGRAATAWFVLTYLLGRQQVRVYDGSWAEWGRSASNPVAQTS